MLPLLPALAPTAQVLIVAEHCAAAPPYGPEQLQLHGWPLPSIALGAPTLHRLVGVANSVWPLSLPQAPAIGLGANVMVTAQFAVTGSERYVLPFNAPPQEPDTVAK